MKLKKKLQKINSNFGYGSNFYAKIERGLKEITDNCVPILAARDPEIREDLKGVVANLTNEELLSLAACEIPKGKVNLNHPSIFVQVANKIEDANIKGNESLFDLLMNISSNAIPEIGKRLRQAAKQTQDANKSAEEQKRPATPKKLRSKLALLLTKQKNSENYTNKFHSEFSFILYYLNLINLSVEF